MSRLSNFQIPPPGDWGEFEDLCRDLWREIWADPNTQKNGRSGQTQHGVDVFGQPEKGTWAGVQCKGKDNYTHARLTEAELRGEVGKARKFTPGLSQFILATTAPRDARIQEVARELSDQNTAVGLFSVHVWSWEDICSALDEHRAVFEKHYGFLLRQPLRPAEAQDRRHLEILLRNVRQFWIKDYLEKSLHAEVLLELGKEVQPDAVSHPWEMQIEVPNQAGEVVPPGKKIVEVFDDFNRAMLILGEPGSGKTVMLLELARDLIARAEADDTFSQPIPVVFNLSSWTDTRQPLAAWIVAELSAKYYVPRRIGRPWLDQNRILPLLDGLDEVRAENRAACVTAINHFAKSFGLPGLVVCSRVAEYTTLPVRLELNGAVGLQPLSVTQVEEYLAAGGAKLEPLRAALKVDSALAELAQSPLTLNIMVIAYCEGDAIPAPRPQTVGASRERLFDAYIERMFKRKGKGDRSYGEDQTKRWLSWLAKGMGRHSQSVFLIEQLQPSWSQTLAQTRMYALCSRFVLSLPLAIIVAITVGSLISMLNVFAAGLSASILAAVNLSSTNLVESGKATLWHRVVAFNHNYILVVVGMSIARVSSGVALAEDVVIYAAWWSLFGFLVFAPGGRFGNAGSDISPVETLRLSWRKALMWALGGFLFLTTAILILIFGSVVRVETSQSGPTWSAVLLFVLLFTLLCASYGAIHGLPLPTSTTPNQGIRRSLRNASIMGIATLILVVLFPLSKYLEIVSRPPAVHAPVRTFEEAAAIFAEGMREAFQEGIALGVLLVALTGFILACTRYGGFAVVKHYTLRILLWLYGYTPLNYVRFLDHVSRLIFMRRVGGGYVFVHRLLLEHFAAMERDEPKG